MKSREERDWIWKMERKEDRLLLSQIFDLYHQYQKTNIPISSEFLNTYEFSIVSKALSHFKIPYSVIRAGAACERVLVCFGESSFLSFYRIRNSEVKHRDVLGALFGCGFRASMIGDIFILEDGVYLTNLKKYDAFIEHEFAQIGKHSIRLEKIECLPEIVPSFQEIFISVSSTRFDLILSKLLHTSRSKALEYMKNRICLVNYQKPLKVSFLKCGDVLSIEGGGKFVICEIQEFKNRRFRVRIQKYR